MSLDVRPYKNEEAAEILKAWNAWMPYDPLNEKLLN